MARKPLLTESEIRSFMKLAELRPLGQDKMQEIAGRPPIIPGLRDDDELDEEEAGPEELEKFAADDLEDDTLHGDEEAATDELEADAELDMEPAMDAEGGADTVSVDDFMSALEVALEDVLGEPVSTEMDSDEEVEDVETDMEIDMGAEGGLEGEVDVALDAEEEEIVPGNRVYENQEDIVNEIARRVAGRLAKENKKAQMVDTLAERIMQRLTK